MKAIVSPSALNKELKKMSHIVGKSKIVPITECVLLEFKDDLLRLTGTDLETTIITEVDCTTNDAFSFPVMMQDLVGICSVCDEMLSFNLNDNTLNISSGKSKFKITLYSESSHFPSVPDAEYTNVFNVDGSIYYAMSVASIFKSKQDTMVSMNKVGLNVKNKSVEVCGTDGFIVYCNSNEYNSKKHNKVLMIPDGFIQATKTFQEGTIELSEKYIKATHGNTVVICSLLEQGFVDYGSIFKKDINWNVQVGKQEIIQSLKKMLISAEVLISISKMDFSNNGIKIYSVNNDLEKEVTDFVECECSANINSVCFNTNTLIQLISSINAGIIELAVDATNSPMYVRPFGDDTNTCIVRPIFFNN